MNTNMYNSRLRYLDADDVVDSTVGFGDLDVRAPDGDKLGDLDGFIVDPTSGRVNYAVVDSGGWFTSRRFLLPIGHAQLDRDRRALNVDVTRDAIRRYPEFDEERFRAFSEDEMRAFEQRMSIACCPDEARSVDAAIQYDTVRHYSQPGWWKREYYQPERARDLQPIASRDVRVRPQHGQPARETQDRELVTARDRSTEAGDMSPHAEGRAQPGDVLGIETGGERSYLGDDDKAENQRRRDAERDAGNLERD
jgi:hypothetical protein